MWPRYGRTFGHFRDDFSSRFFRIYAFLAVYLFACSIILTVKSFTVRHAADINQHTLIPGYS